jgi:tetratricopeptide (TPR) repeat protein
MDMARSVTVKNRAERLLERGERADARQQAIELDESDDDRWARISMGWEEAQEEEYEEYGESFREALLAMDAGEAKPALEKLTELKKEHGEEAIYLWLELARARSRADDHEGARKALTRFLKRVPDDDRSEARLNAYAYLAQLAEKDGDEEKAIKQLEKALEAMPDDPRPFLQLGSYLRQKGHPDEAVEILEVAITLTDVDRPNPTALEELGLAQRDAGHVDAAIETLERVIGLYVQRAAVADFPPVAAATLAALHEKKGNLPRAADLWSSLARGKDRAGHLLYHREAGRVLGKLEMVSEARRMLTRASALAEGQPELVATIEAEIAALDAR